MMDGKIVGVPATAAERAALMDRERAAAQALASYALTQELEAMRLLLAGLLPQSDDSLALIEKSTQVANAAGTVSMQALKAAGVHVTVKPKENGAG